MLVPFMAAESAATWLQGEDRGRGGRYKIWRCVSTAERIIFKVALENTRRFN